MTEAVIATGKTNPKQGTIVNVPLTEMVCKISIEKNIYSDFLPIIPTRARVKDKKKVLYRLAVKAELTELSTGKKVQNYGIKFMSSRENDNVIFSGKTNEEGLITVVLETYEAGDVELKSTNSDVTSTPLKIVLKDAWYESTFLITGYHVCNESDFSGELVKAKGLNETHKEDFLYSARGVPMQGTGMAADGKYIALNKMPNGWTRNSRGAPDQVASRNTTSFKYANGVNGKFGLVTENHSIAIDPTIIPPGARVEIDGVGERSADDTGGGIDFYHIDNFLGAGKAVVKAWLRGKVNGTQRKVKYLGD